MTTVDILKRWLKEHDVEYDLHHIPYSVDYSHNFTIWEKCPRTGVTVSRMWMMVGKSDPLHVFAIMLGANPAPNRHMNIGDPDFFSDLENTI
jgi:hypothetical protein